MPLVLAAVLLAVAVAATIDWWAVSTDRPRLEAVAKPLVMVGLIVVALTMNPTPESARWWLVAALLCGLVGDVFLLPQVDRFLGGLAAFLAGHVLYLLALLPLRANALAAIIGLGIAALMLKATGLPILKSVRGSALAVPVALYMATVGAVVVVGWASGRWLLAGGAASFAASDALLGMDRFVEPAPQRRVWVHWLYHLGQVGLVLGFV